MAVEQNKAVVRRLIEEAFNRRNQAAIDEVATPAAAVELREALDPWRSAVAAFPDLRIKIDDLTAEGELVVCRSSLRGAHADASACAAPDGRSTPPSATSVYRVVGDKIVESRQGWDALLGTILGGEAADGNGHAAVALREPVLDLGEIQGNVLLGFDTNHQVLLFFSIESRPKARAWLKRIASQITTLGDVLALRRPERSEAGGRGGRPAPALPPWRTIGFTFQGLKKLGAEAEQCIDAPFKAGIHNRSKILGDPVEPDAEGNCVNWVVGGPRNVPDVCLIVADDEPRSLAAEAARMKAAAADGGLRLLYEQPGSVLPPPLTGHEHFGFLDNISQPGVRGRLSDSPDDFLTRRQNASDPHQGKPGQNLVWPGEFVFGYPGQNSLDKVRPGLTIHGGPTWARNGSFLVFRRLRQDVEALHEFISHAASELVHEVPALSGMTPELLAAKMMGRWKSGAPVMRAPQADEPALGRDACAQNNFGFIKPLRPLANGRPGECSDKLFRQSVADPLGLVCPHAAHIRKVYPRDHPTSEISEANIETHRLLRRGIPYGDPYPAPCERGLLFLAYQTSIERQFEFITRAWLNNPHLRDGDDGYDPVVGQNSSKGQGRVRTFSMPVQGADGDIIKINLELPKEWVVPTGGGYFFVPSLSALKEFAG